MMGYGQPGMLPPRPRYPPGGQVPGMPMPPYGGPHPQYGGGMPNYPRGGPRPPGSRGGPGSSPTNPNAPMPRANGTSPGNGPAPRPAPQQGSPARAPAGGAPSGGRPPQNYKLNPQTRNAGVAAPGGQAGPAQAAAQSEVPTLTAASLAGVPSMEQKQMLGEVIYMKIVSTQPELAGKITGMLLEMENSELLHLLEAPDAMASKVNEALIVLHDFSKDTEVPGAPAA